MRVEVLHGEVKIIGEERQWNKLHDASVAINFHHCRTTFSRFLFLSSSLGKFIIHHVRDECT